MEKNKDSVRPYCYDKEGERKTICKQCGFVGCKNARIGTYSAKLDSILEI